MNQIVKEHNPRLTPGQAAHYTHLHWGVNAFITVSYNEFSAVFP
jgi:hypothetical protein